MGISRDDVAALHEASVRGLVGYERQIVAAATAASLRVACNLLQGIAEPTAVDVETKERL